MHTVVLFSYPRSGNTWLRYMIEVFTGRPSLGNPASPVDDTPIHTRMEGLTVDPDAVPSAVKRHELQHMEEGDEQRPLIVAVRNYKECMVRHRYHLRERKRPFALETESRLYMAPLAYFEDHGSPKLLLYYEDLLENPVVAITSLARFLEIPEKTSIDFLDRYEEHRTRSLRSYPSHTLGETTLYHAFRLSPLERRAWDRQVRTLNPALYDRYLARYQELD